MTASKSLPAPAGSERSAEKAEAEPPASLNRAGGGIGGTGVAVAGYGCAGLGECDGDGEAYA